jgi:chemotaxis protein methyltransferase CheR
MKEVASQWKDSAGFPISAAEFSLFRKMIYIETGIALADSKSSLVSSRLGRRLRHFGFDSFQKYYDHLIKVDVCGEEGRMINCITTNKTSFFRESHHFDLLRKLLLNPLQLRAATGQPRRLRIWSAACSTGQEPYSIAIVIREAIASVAAWDIKILASDIDTDVLARAERGVYEMADLDDMPPAQRARHFLRGTKDCQGLVSVNPDLRRLVHFRRVNFVDPAWPVRGKFDAIFCRNVLIYFDRPTQYRLLSRLAGLLKPEGYLFVGHSENLYWFRDLLVPVDNSVYRVETASRPI